jgi:hypothetical protein
MMFLGVKLASHAGLNTLQNILFFIDTIPELFAVILSNLAKYAVDKGWNKPTSKGCNRCVV